MTRGVIPSIAVKVLSGIISFLLIIIYTNTLGADGVGSIALVVLSVSMVVMANDFIGGAALIYFTPRIKLKSLLQVSYAWALGVNVLSMPLLMLLPFELSQVLLISLIATLQCLNSIHLNVFVGSQKVGLYNILATLQFILLLISVTLLFFVIYEPQVKYFIWALCFAHGSVYVLSAGNILKLIRSDRKENQDGVFRTLIKHGGYVQAANISQLLNYRISYYLLELMAGINARALVGMVSTTNNIAESVWYIPKGISVVQYGKISNMKDDQEKTAYTTMIFRMVLLVTVPIVAVLAVLPATFFEFVFGDEFGHIANNILYILPGIILLGQSTTLVNYFSGTGRYQVNARGSIVGLAVTVVCGFFLIREYMVTGALVTASLSYGTTFLYMLFSFAKHTKVKAGDFVPRLSDITAWKKQFFKG